MPEEIPTQQRHSKYDGDTGNEMGWNAQSNDFYIAAYFTITVVYLIEGISVVTEISQFKILRSHPAQFQF